MNAEEIQYSLDRRNYVNLTGTPAAVGDVVDKPIQLGHLAGDVIIESETWGGIGYLGPPGRAVFEYNYTGVQDPPRIFFKTMRCRNPGTGTYNVADVSFFRVIQPNTSPKAIFIENCRLANDGCYLIDGPDVSGCDGIQIKHTECDGSGFIRWKLRDAANLGFFEVYNTRYQTGDLVGPVLDIKNVRNSHLCVYAAEQLSNLIPELQNNYAGPLSQRVVNPRGFNFWEHNWNEYGTNFDNDAPGCWGTSIRVDDTTGNYGQHHVRVRQWQLQNGSGTGVDPVHFYGGHDSANAGSLFVERLDNFSAGTHTFGGKVFPRMEDGQDMTTAQAAEFSDLNSGGLINRLEVFDADGQPVLFGNTRTPYYNTEYRIGRTRVMKDYETVLWEQAQRAYGGKNCVTSEDGSSLVILFRASDTLTVTETIEVEYLICGGGGSGGCKNDTSLDGGGGGAGGYATNFGGTKVTLTAGTYPIVVGEGGQFEWGTYGAGVDGGSSSFNGITMAGGGGGGGSADLITYTDGNDGASGGGASGQGGAVGGSSDAYGNDGGSSDEVSGSSGPSGGGGAGGVGGNGYLDGVIFGGNGGLGIANAITGTSVTYCEGGGGGTNNGNNGDGGVENGGWPRTSLQSGKERDGKANLGSGGAGGANAAGSTVSYPGNGSDGVVIIRVAPPAS